MITANRASSSLSFITTAVTVTLINLTITYIHHLSHVMESPFPPSSHHTTSHYNRPRPSRLRLTAGPPNAHNKDKGGQLGRPTQSPHSSLRWVVWRRANTTVMVGYLPYISLPCTPGGMFMQMRKGNLKSGSNDKIGLEDMAGRLIMKVCKISANYRWQKGSREA